MMVIMQVHNAGDYGHHQVVMLIMTVYMVVWILEIGSDDSKIIVMVLVLVCGNVKYDCNYGDTWYCWF